MSDTTGLIFVGKLDGGTHVKADLRFNGESVTVDGPLWFTLDQWIQLRTLGQENEEYPIWATTEAEYEDSTGLKLYV